MTSNPQLPPNKVIGSSAALNQTTNCAKKGSSKKKVATKPKSANETTSTNLARLILNNLNIFSKCFKKLFKTKCMFYSFNFS